jgi:hypothetical protein
MLVLSIEKYNYCRVPNHCPGRPHNPICRTILIAFYRFATLGSGHWILRMLNLDWMVNAVKSTRRLWSRWIWNSASGDIRITFSVNPFCLLLLCFLISFFFFPLTLTPHYERLALYDDLNWRMQGNSLLLTILSIFVLPWLKFTFCVIAPFFLGRLNGMAMDISSLASGLGGHALKIGLKDSLFPL